MFYLFATGKRKLHTHCTCRGLAGVILVCPTPFSSIFERSDTIRHCQRTHHLTVSDTKNTVDISIPLLPPYTSNMPPIPGVKDRFPSPLTTFHSPKALCDLQEYTQGNANPQSWKIKKMVTVQLFSNRATRWRSPLGSDDSVIPWSGRRQQRKKAPQNDPTNTKMIHNTVKKRCGCKCPDRSKRGAGRCMTTR